MQSQEVNNLTQINIYTEKAVDDSCVSFYHYTHARLIYTCVWWSLYTYKQIYQELKCPTSWDQWDQQGGVEFVFVADKNQE